MKSYSRKKLAGINVNEYCETIKMHIAKDAATYLFKNQRSHALGEAVICIFFTVAFTYFYLSGLCGLGQCLFMLAAIILSCVFGSLIAPYGQYREWKQREAFYLINECGINTVSKSTDKKRFVREDFVRWEFVRKIKFYDDHIIISWKIQPLEIPKNLLLWSENMGRDKQTILTFWARAVHKEEVEIPILYSENDITEIEGYINKKFGKYESVFHEWYSPDIHVDVYVIPPTDDRNYYTLCTIGAGARTMDMGEVWNLPPEKRPADHAEYMMYLPADWDFSEKGMEDERNYWPIRLLKRAARCPIETQKHLAWGNAVCDKDCLPFVFNIPFCCGFLLAPAPTIRTASLCNLSSGITVEYYQVFPITEKELNIKKGKKGTEKLLKTIKDAQHEDLWTDFAVRRLKQNQAPYKPHPNAEPYHYEELHVPMI